MTGEPENNIICMPETKGRSGKTEESIRRRFFRRYGTGYALVRPFLYFDPSTLLRPKPYFDFFRQKLLRPIYFHQNCNSTCTSRPIRSPDLTKGRSTGRNTEKVEDMKMVEVQKRSN